MKNETFCISLKKDVNISGIIEGHERRRDLRIDQKFEETNRK